jgi:threonine aldolase
LYLARRRHSGRVRDSGTISGNLPVLMRTAPLTVYPRIMLVDLRSDTVTRPTPEMRRAMAEAEVGDDVFSDDPTVNKLQELAAKRLGKEAGIFVPTGTMGNQIAVKTHTKPGDAIIVDEDCHIIHYEVGGPAVHSHVITETVPSERGIMSYEAVKARIRQESTHTPGTSLLCLENTHNRAGGTIIPLEHMQKLSEAARRAGLKVHLDGARLFNASVASGVDIKEFAACADTVMFCFSKGLCCPVGSMLVGSREFIDRAHRIRKLMGGGMRQVGVLAACGLVALEKMVDRLADDHRRARHLAEALDELPGLRVDREPVQPNMVFAETDVPAKQIQNALAEREVVFLPVASKRIRLVLHNDVDDEKLDLAIGAFRSVLKA